MPGIRDLEDGLAKFRDEIGFCPSSVWGRAISGEKKPYCATGYIECPHMEERIYFVKENPIVSLKKEAVCGYCFSPGEK